jgi:flagellar hook protein FlgE
MISSLTSGVTGLESYQQQMNVIGNNIANVNTEGFKSGSVDFADAFSNILQSPSNGTGTTTGSNTIEVGTGVTIAAINTNWNQGSLSATGVQSDLAISGNGFFQVKDPISGATFATRAGSFSVDQNGYLVTDTGERVQGNTSATSGTIGDIQISQAVLASQGYTGSATMVSYSIDGQGNVNYALSDGSTFKGGQVLLQNYSDPDKLVSEGNNLFSNTLGAGPTTATAVAAGTNGLGNIQAGDLELSNVDLSNEMANLISAQRAFEANSKIITTSDQVLEIVNHLKQ